MTGASYPDVKRCGGCQEEKPLDAFNRDASKASGRASHCKACKGQYSARWRDAHPDYMKAYSQQYRESHREQFAAYSRQWRVEHPGYYDKYRKPRQSPPKIRVLLTPERRTENRRRWFEQNRERLNEQRRIRRLTDPIFRAREQERTRLRRKKPENAAKHAERRRRWYEANRIQLLPIHAERQREWARANPEKIQAIARVTNHRRRAVGEFTRAEWDELCDRYGHRCLCCGRSDRRLTVDHVVPVAKGGTSWISNIQPLCWPCNRRKGNRTIDYRPESAEVVQANLF